MARTGDVIENPISGQNLIFRTTTKEGGGELLEVESVYTKPTPFQPPVHYHPGQEERFEVLSGRVRFRKGARRIDAEAGDVVVVTHVSPIKAAIAWAIGAGDEIAWRLYVRDASVHRILTGPPGPRLVAFNELHPPPG